MKERPVRIIASAEHKFEPLSRDLPLSNEDKMVLYQLWQKKSAYIGLTYLSLIGIIILAIIQGYGRTSKLKLEEQFFHVVPFFGIGAFSLLTFYFYRFYRKEAHGFRRDLQKGIKKEIAFSLVKHEMPVFSKFFVRTPIEQHQLIQLNREDFEMLLEGGTLIFEVFPESNHIHKLRFGDKEIKYF
ncbi:MAG: hypothetical protein SFU20_05420 [Chitinophagaceae bacterium]|nr:hypothetical protein [Chitinophagaceae bacterium]